MLKKASGLIKLNSKTPFIAHLYNKSLEDNKTIRKYYISPKKPKQMLQLSNEIKCHNIFDLSPRYIF